MKKEEMKKKVDSKMVLKPEKDLPNTDVEGMDKEPKKENSKKK